jgi:hypothetical protein
LDQNVHLLNESNNLECCFLSQTNQPTNHQHPKLPTTTTTTTTTITHHHAPSGVITFFSTIPLWRVLRRKLNRLNGMKKGGQPVSWGVEFSVLNMSADA